MMWTYRAQLVRVVDGDTVDVLVDLGFGVQITQRVRVAGVDAAERNTVTGAGVTAWARDWIAAHSPHGVLWPLTLTSSKPRPTDKYGRYVADITATVGGDSLAAAMLAAGIVEVYR